jgi:hypothetical protein
MTEHLLLRANESVAAGSMPVASMASWNGAGHGRRRVPAAVPRDQLYYWTYLWQAGISRSREELAAGEFRDFETSSEAIRWLLSDEGD